jgi:hypothetical protein
MALALPFGSSVSGPRCLEVERQPGWHPCSCRMKQEAEPKCVLLGHVSLEHETHRDVSSLFCMPSVFEP